MVDAEEREIPLGGDPLAMDPHKRGYPAYVWETVGSAALEQVLGTADAMARNGAAGALEEDARLTALFLWTLQSTNGGNAKNGKAEVDAEEDDEEDEGELRGKAKGHTMIFDVVRRFAQPLGINLPKWEGRIIETKKGVVRLLPVSERAKVLFGSEGAKAVAYQLESTSRPDTQLLLFPGAKEHVVAARGAGGKRSRSMTQAAELSADAAVMSGRSIDRANQPEPYKRYPGLETIPLPRDLKPPDVMLSSFLDPGKRKAEVSTISLDDLSLLLFLTLTFTARSRDFVFRSAASAGALYPKFDEQCDWSHTE